MAMKTLGTTVWFYDEIGSAVVKIGCITDVPELSREREVIEAAPCLETGFISKFLGAVKYGDVTLPINFDFSDTSHMALRAILEGDGKINLVIGAEDGSNTPTWNATANDWTLATSRSWIKVPGLVSKDSIAFPAGGATTGSITISPSNIIAVAKT